MKIFSFYTHTYTARESSRTVFNLSSLATECDNHGNGDNIVIFFFFLFFESSSLTAVASVTKCIQQYPNLTTIKTRKAIHIFFRLRRRRRRLSFFLSMC